MYAEDVESGFHSEYQKVLPRHRHSGGYQKVPTLAYQDPNRVQKYQEFEAQRFKTGRNIKGMHLVSRGSPDSPNALSVAW